MSKHSHIQRLPVEVDPFRLVEQGRIYQGRIPVGDYPRLKELLFDGDSDNKNRGIEDSLLHVFLEFTKTETRLPVIKGKISATLKMPCQRCLKEELVPFETELEVVLVSSDAQAERLQEGYDTWLVEDQRLFLQDFIEDEVLLAMPLVVTHEACEAAKELIEVSFEERSADDAEEELELKENPFAVLKDLKLN